MNPIDGASQTKLPRAWYSAPVSEFLQSGTDTILGQLTGNSSFSVEITQRTAWLRQIEILQRQLMGLNGHLFFEFSIPRMGRRIDVVLIAGAIVFAIEFKVGGEKFDRAALDQVWDYALDLKNFHEGSHFVSIVPILIATEAKTPSASNLIYDADQVARPVAITSEMLADLMRTAMEDEGVVDIDALKWVNSSYRPTPTIIEAAQALYASHSVEAITCFDAGRDNLRLTSARVQELVDITRAQQQKAICFVTGVPGAGKTLVGLNLATVHGEVENFEHAVFLSGNGPLVDVLREALTRDEVARKKAIGQKVSKSKVKESVKAFIQNVHHFRDDALQGSGAPSEHVVIFDEAQRAWNLQQTANFMQRKKNVPDFAQSEPEFLISCMDRHPDWAFIVCLVGGGQEINYGEAGIGAWLEAVTQKFPEWKIYISSKLTGSEYTAGNFIEVARGMARTQFEEHLHLSVSMRSFRAESLSEFIRALLDCETQVAAEAFEKIKSTYPIAVTRDLQLAKKWITDHARASQRYGLVASSKAMRLRPHAIDIRVKIDPVHWFLNDKTDVRSSYYLEDAATEFQVQGLELDWVCVNWDGDLRYRDGDWTYHDFKGRRWLNMKNIDNRNYLKNAYRVLLTRARQGMAIFIPPGDPNDHTRPPAYYDETFRYLTELGLPVLK